MRIPGLIVRAGLVLVLTLICIPLIWLAFTAFEAYIIVYQAERIAGSRPYCIVVSSQNRPIGYEPATRLADLTYSNLTAQVVTGGSRGSIAVTYYALLVLEQPKEIRNWSKTSLNFEADVTSALAPKYQDDPNKLCTPTINFSAFSRQ